MADRLEFEPIVIIGGGMAGGMAAATLREEGYDGRLIMLSPEPGIPFGRPPLSKEYLRGDEDLSGWAVKPADWYTSNRVEMLDATAASVQLAPNRVILTSGRSIPFAKLLIATGGRNRQLRVPGSALPGIFQLRTVGDCDAIRASIQRSSHAVVVGTGFIGCEVSASLRQLGLQVTAIGAGRWPLGSVLGDDVGRVMASIHSEVGVNLIAPDSVVAFHGSDRVEAVSTGSGRRIGCDMAVVAVGIQPNTEPFDGSGLLIDGGVLVDAECRASHPDVFAAGDVANHLHPLFGRIRIEHYNNAEKQAVAAARSMLGRGRPYDYIHSFWSDQYEHKLEYVGHARRWDRFVVRGDLDGRKFVGFYLEGGKVRAAVGLNRGGDPELEPGSELAVASNLIASDSPLSAEELEIGQL